MDTRKKVIALGFFDGVHLGHQALLRRVMERSSGVYMPALFTFDRPPREVVTGVPVPRLSTGEERRGKIVRLFPGMEVLEEPFDRTLMVQSWQGFLESLTQRHQAGWFVAGHDFRFGYRNEGDVESLRHWAEKRGLGCDVIPAVYAEGNVVSSTRIRALLEEGDVEAAARLLGEPYALSGPVAHGKGLGRRLGAPTINLLPAPGRQIPGNGVYVTHVEIDGRVCPAVTNVGVRPTVEDRGRLLVESHLLDWREQLYGRQCRIEFLRRLRGETRFASLEALSRQIQKDAGDARRYFEETI